MMDSNEESNPLSSDFMQQVSELQKKARMFEIRRENDRKIISEVNILIEQAQKVKLLLDPASKLKSGFSARKGKNARFVEIAKEVYGLLQAGTFVNKDFVEKTYRGDDLTYQQINTIMRMIEKMPNVDTSWKGRVKSLFRKKE